MQMLDKEQQVKGDLVFFQDFETPHDLVAHDEINIGFVVGYVTNANELGVFSQLHQLLLTLGAGEVDPAHNAGNEIAIPSQTQHPVVLFQVMLSLHKYRFLNAHFLNQRPQIIRQETATYRLQQWGLQPVVGKPPQFPKMLMRVDGDHGSGNWVIVFRTAFHIEPIVDRFEYRLHFPQ